MQRFDARRRSLLAALLAIPALHACGGGSDAPAPAPEPAPTPTPPPPAPLPVDGLAGRVVRRLRPSPHGLLAATDDGVYLRTAQGWQARGPALGVRDVVSLGGITLLASVVSLQGMPLLLRSRDAGATWEVVIHDFGGAQGPEGIQALAYDAVAGCVLATGAAVLAESFDGGEHWTRRAGDWHALAGGSDALAFDPVRGDPWFGGQNAIEGFTLFALRRAANRVDSFPGLMPAPSTAKGIRFAAGEPQRVLVAGEGGIVQTRDDGVRWERLLDRGHRFYFDVVQDPNRPQRWVTAGWDKNFDTPQPLVVEISEDGGRTWWRASSNDPTLFGGAWSLAVTLEAGRTVVWFGLFRGGVVRMPL